MNGFTTAAQVRRRSVRFLLAYCLPSICGILGISNLLATVAMAQMEDVALVTRATDATPSALNPDNIHETPLTAADREHWAFRPVIKSDIPEVTNRGWARNGLDTWIQARLEEAGMTPAVETNRATWLRRVSYLLTGLPPDVDDLLQFEADESVDARERQIDRLLASPGYGERWAQHWLDLARFAETDGFEHDKVRPNVWKFRDWVVTALNENLPYDQFVQLQIAGDEIDGANQSVATMFCLSGPDMPDINDQFERRHFLLNEMTSTVGSVFLGLQLGCAECHDHKYDPISQNDFYQLRAVFESAVPTLKRDVVYLQLKEQPDAIPARFWIRGDHRRPGPHVDPAFPRIGSRNKGGDVPADGVAPRRAFAQWLVQPENPLTSRIIVNRIWKHHFGRGLFETPSDVGLLNDDPSHPEVLDWLAAELQDHQWNLKWLHRQIVCSATFQQCSHDDDGTASNPKRERGTAWKLRLQKDPDNRLFSRSHRHRLDGESLRDGMLFISGMLNDQQSGPGVMPPLPEDLVGTLLKGQWTTSPRSADHVRRSIYLFTRRNLRYPLFEAFDRPDANASCAVRTRSTTAPQSLLLLNSELSLTAAQCLAGRAIRHSSDRPRQIDRIVLHAFSRHPSADELSLLERFIDHERERLVDVQPRPEKLALPVGATLQDPYAAAALVEACLGILNANEMLYLD